MSMIDVVIYTLFPVATILFIAFMVWSRQKRKTGHHRP